ncbi:hypothetical protein IEQ34_025802 [Dendrobium chrysotoxum]|uniref:Uncharacterized protein n=1 Tax=Dendrobium chrysotoxum TaxID=161865 RepID=A0AAV7FPM0_DENCH|nr:hypothetical protein IEQ34_025802 [Dendrobium chrysotoxum]
MDSFFVTGVDPKAIMSQNEEAIEKLFLAPLSRTSLGIPFYLSNKKVGPSCTLLRNPCGSELRSRRNRTFDGPALFYAPLDPKMSFALLGAGLSVVREKEKGLIFCCIWHEMKRESFVYR